MRVNIKFGKTKVEIVKTSYIDNNNTALQAFDCSNGYLWDILTVNLTKEPIKENQAFIDTNNLSKENYQTLIDKKIISEEIIKTVQSGFCSYPLHEILI